MALGAVLNESREAHLPPGVLAGAVTPDGEGIIVGGFIGESGRIVPQNAVCGRAGNTRQFTARVDLVDHDLHVQRVATLRIRVAGVVTGHAILDGNAIAAVTMKLVAVAALATGG